MEILSGTFHFCSPEPFHFCSPGNRKQTRGVGERAKVEFSGEQKWNGAGEGGERDF
jgi:hypothetical protein